YLQNFGCRATQADGAALEHQLQGHGLSPAQTPANSDLVVLNTCTVTSSADQDARAAIRRVHRQNPNARIVVTGCYAQRAPQEIAMLPGVSCVIGNSHKHQLAEIALPKMSTPAALGQGKGWEVHHSDRAISDGEVAALAPQGSTFVPLTT